MRRLHIVSLVVSVVVLVALGLLVRRALQSVEVERAARHRAIADRVLDEMERELTAWLAVEENRPYEEYRFFVVPAEPGLRLARSALSEPPAHPFVLGYFQVEPDGAVTSPRWPGNESLAVEAGWRPDPAERQRSSALRDAVESWLAAYRSERAPSGTPAPGRYDRRGSGPAPATPEPPALPAESPKKGKLAEAAPQRYLDSLNRGAEDRQQRASKVQKSQAPSAYNFEEPEDNVLQQALAPQLRADGGAAAAPVVSADVVEQLERELPAGGEVDVLLEPMVGRRLADGRLLLYRTVVVGERVYRQGAVLDAGALAAWLGQRVLAGSALAGSATLAPAPTRAVAVSDATAAGTTTAAGRDADVPAPWPQPPAGGFAYPHRFAEPFGGLQAALLLAPLPELAGDRHVVALSAALALATFLGLLALYRMAAVALQFAERRSNFVAAVTHELKTPLTAIRMYAEMLRDGLVATEPKRQECYDILTAESERLSRLLDNVLELGRLERGQRPMTLRKAALAPAVEEVLQVLRPHAASKDFALRLVVDGELPPVAFERDALAQVLFNLVDNALKYAREATDREILIRLEPAGGGVILTVRDRGPGVPAAHLRHVFEPFYRGEDERTRTATGAGIGLSLVRQLVERMDGRVTGRNHPEGGFEVAVALPTS